MFPCKTKSGGLILAACVVAFVAAQLTLADDDAKPNKPPVAAKQEAKQKAAAEKKAADEKKGVPLEIKLPKPAFKGTPKHVPAGTRLEKPRKGPRPPLIVPKGVRNISKGRPVTSSDSEPIIGELKLVTDGDAEANAGAYVELGPGVQWVQIDLGGKYAIHALLIWHYHMNARVYHDVVVQVADDEDFIENVRTLYSNDHDNSAGLGIGESKEYWDTFEGKLLDTKGVVARYVRLYSQGNIDDDMNHYTEVEVFGLPVK